MVLIGGFLIDRIGTKKATLIFTVLCVTGAYITLLDGDLTTMATGRLIFGLGAESMIVAITTTIAKWFKGKELALAFGTKIGIARLGSSAAFFFTYDISERASHWTIAIWFSVLLLCIGLLAFFVYTFFDRKLDKQIEQTQLRTAKDEFKISDLWELLTNRSFIFVTLICLTFYSAVFPFQSFSADFFLNKFGEIDQSLSGKIAAILSVGTFTFTPIIGFLVDRYGKSASLMIYGSVLLVVIYLTFAFTMLHPSIPMLFLGIAFSLVPAAMWPSVAKIVEERKIGTAYGTMFTIQNLGLWAVPLLIGIVLDSTNPNISPEALRAGETYDYTWVILMLASLGILGVIFAVLLKREDKISGYGLELPSRIKGKNTK